MSSCDSAKKDGFSQKADAINRIEIPFRINESGEMHFTGELARPGSVAGFRPVEPMYNDEGELRQIQVSTDYVSLDAGKYRVQLLTDVHDDLASVLMSRDCNSGEDMDSVSWTVYEAEMNILCNQMVKLYGERYCVQANKISIPAGCELIWRVAESGYVSIRIATRKLLRDIYGKDIRHGLFEGCVVYFSGDRGSYARELSKGNLLLDSSMSDSEKRKRLF